MGKEKIDLGPSVPASRLPACEPEEACLRLLATTDLHAQMTARDLCSGAALAGRGLTRLATLIAEARAGAETALLFDNGDFLTGSPLSDEAEGAALVVAAMNRLGYDAVGLGNHEFSRGLPFLAGALAAAEFPVLSANLRQAGGGPLFRPHVILRLMVRDGAGRSWPVAVGVTSVLPVQTALWERHHLQGQVTVRPLLAAVRAEVRALRRRGAEVVVVLAHCGLAEDESRPRDRVNLARAVAGLAGVDAVIAGHTHAVFPPGPVRGSGEGAALVLPGAMGSHLAVIDLRLRRQGCRWQVAGHESALRATQPEGAGPVPEDAALTALAAPLLRRLEQRLDRPVCHSPQPLETCFALVRDGAVARLLAGAMLAHVGASGVAGALPVVAAVAPPRTGGRGGPGNYLALPAGPLRERDLAGLVPFDDAVVAVEMRGRHLRRWLERAAGLFRQVAPGARDAPLLRPGVPGFLFDAIYGLDYRIDLAAPAWSGGRGLQAGRIRDLHHAGRPVAPGDSFVLVTTSHRLAGGGAFPLPGRLRPLPLPVQGLREVLRAALTGAGGAAVTAPPAWSFVPMPGTTACFDSAPGARPPDAGIEPLGAAPGGFQRFRLHL